MSMSKLVWKEYQHALNAIDALNAESRRQLREIEGLKSQARDWKARTRILAKRCKEYEAKEANTFDAKDVLPAGLYEFDGEEWRKTKPDTSHVPVVKGIDIEKEECSSVILDQVREALKTPEHKDIVQHARELVDDRDGWKTTALRKDDEIATEAKEVKRLRKEERQLYATINNLNNKLVAVESAREGDSDAVLPPQAFFRQRKLGLNSAGGWDLITQEDRAHWFEEYTRSLEG